MDPTTRFFSKLRKLAVTVDSETVKLQQAFENRNDDGDGETTAKAMRAYHEVNCDVGKLKGQIRDQLAQQKAQENEMSNFIKACRVMEQRVTKDIQTLKGHWEKYGYQAPCDTQRPCKASSQQSEAEDKVADEDESDSMKEEKEGSQEEDGDNQSSSPPTAEPPFTDGLRTPRLSDFGLSGMQLKRTLAQGCFEAPPMPEMRLPLPSLNTPAPPPMPITPKCALRMDEDEPQTPQMHDFGISEYTMCLNNDFTMDLFRKNAEKNKKPPQNIPEPPVNSVMESLQTKAEELESPEQPVFCTPGFKIRKTNGQCSPPAQGNGDPEFPGHPGNLLTTPPVPAFKTPYMNRLVSTKSARQTEPIAMQTADEGHTSDPTPPRNVATGFKCNRESDVPDKQMPEMPNLESVLGNSLQSRSAKALKISEHGKVSKDPSVSSLELDGPTQEFSLGTPHIRMSYEEPSTPEMPDLSSVTQDICKLVSQAKKTTTVTVQPHVRPEKGRRSPVPRYEGLSVVSEEEFQSLPNYLRQMTLYNLNQAVHNINRFIEEHQGEITELQMEPLKRVISVGTKAPMYILCLTELKRMTHVDGVRNTSVYKLITHN
ncbi:SKA complex subunit 3 [Brachyistius frenatus]|uniref:SKA complex subunit 3 n=1 Tax=Brachyistius frenatus TaxID=100188 RepID=UPI0037E9AE7F